MNIPVLVINLDRSNDRWEGISARAKAHGITPLRIPAVDGNAADPAERKELRLGKFQLWHGRRPMGAEYGCYLSHIRALERVVSEGWPHAVILEDDADFCTDFSRRVQALAKLEPSLEVVKLYNHRTKGFIVRNRTEAGDLVGRCVHGPLGSSMGYLVSQEGARKLRDGLLPMFLPFDTALERGWAHGAAIFTTREALLQQGPVGSTIGSYRKTKFSFYLRIPTAFFRGLEYVRRAIYAMSD